jgi:hypothetical protein
VIRGKTVTTPDGVWTFGPNGETLLNGENMKGGALEYAFVPAINALYALTASDFYQFTNTPPWYWAKVDSIPGIQLPVPVSVPDTDPTIESPNASPDRTVIDQPWQVITDWNGDTYILSDRKGSKDSGTTYVGYECGRVFEQIVPGLAEQIPWTPAVDDGVMLPARWVPLDENYQPIADDRTPAHYALIAGEGYGYAFKFAYVGGNLYQYGKRWYLSSRPGLRLEAWRSEGATDPFAPPVVIIPPIITPRVGDREMLGGWRFPIGQNSNLSNPGTGQNCLAINFDIMEARVSTGGGTIMRFNLPAMGRGTDPSAWPLVQPVNEVPIWWPYGYTSGLLFWRGKYWAAPKVFYDTAPPMQTQLIAEDGESIWIGSMFNPVGRQSFAGFVKRGPGEDPYIGDGGDESGQGGMRGPSLATLDGKRLIEYGRPFQLAEPGDPLAHWNDCAPREPNYFTIDHNDSWVSFEPRLIDGVLQGRWAADRVFSGGLVLPEGITYFPWMATGEVSYLRQEPTFGKWQDRRTYRYVYDADTYKLKGYELTGLGEVRGQELGPDGTVYLSFLHQWSHPSLGMTVGAFA